MLFLYRFSTLSSSCSAVKWEEKAAAAAAALVHDFLIHGLVNTLAVDYDRLVNIDGIGTAERHFHDNTNRSQGI